MCVGHFRGMWKTHLTLSTTSVALFFLACHVFQFSCCTHFTFHLITYSVKLVFFRFSPYRFPLQFVTILHYCTAHKISRCLTSTHSDTFVVANDSLLLYATFNMHDSFVRSFVYVFVYMTMLDTLATRYQIA